MTGDIIIAAKLIGAGLAMIGAIGSGAGIGIVTSGAVQAMGRNPDATGTIQTNMILGIAFAEAVAIYCLAVALIIIFPGIVTGGLALDRAAAATWLCMLSGSPIMAERGNIRTSM